MVRGTVYGSVGAAFGLTWPGLDRVASWPLFALLLWPFVFAIGAPLLMFAAVAVQTLQRELQGRVRGRLYVPLAVSIGCPFGILACGVARIILGKTGWTWSDLEWIPYLSGALAAGIGLGFGCVHDVVYHDV